MRSVILFGAWQQAIVAGLAFFSSAYCPGEDRLRPISG